MIAYHEGDGLLIPLASSESSADKISFLDTLDLNATNVQTALERLKAVLEEQFGSGATAIYNAIVAKGTTPSSKSVNDLVYAIYQITTEIKHTGVYNAVSRNTYSNDMGSYHTYRYVNTSGVPNQNAGVYVFEADSVGTTKDLGADNTIRYVNAEHVYDKGYADGRQNVYSNITTHSIVLYGDQTPYATVSYMIPSDIVGFSVSGSCGVRLHSEGQPEIQDVYFRGTVRRPNESPYTLYFYNNTTETNTGEGHYVVTSGGGNGYIIEVILDVRNLYRGKRGTFACAFITMWK